MRCPRFPTSDFGAAQCISNRKAKLVLTYSRQTPRAGQLPRQSHVSSPRDSLAFSTPPTVETVGYHLSRPRRWGCVQLPSFPFREEEEQNRSANCYFRNLTALSSRPILCL